MTLLTRLLSAALCIASITALYQSHRAQRWASAYHRLETDTRTASARATADQIATNHQPAAISAAIAKVSDAKAPAYYRRALDVADLHRLRPALARGPGSADLPRTDPAPPLNDRSPAPANLVCRPQSDDDLLVAAAARAAQMRADATALIAAGVAVAGGAVAP
jgi:hypothetical protein